MVYASCNVTSLYLLYDTMLEPGIINHDFSMIAKFSKNQARTLETTVDIKIYSPIESTCSATMDEDTAKKNPEKCRGRLSRNMEVLPEIHVPSPVEPPIEKHLQAGAKLVACHKT